MPQRILLVEESPLVAALCPSLGRAGFEVEQVRVEDALARLEVGGEDLAIVRPESEAGFALARTLKGSDPRLPVVLVFPDEQAAGREGAAAADAVLVQPLAAPAVVSLCRVLSRLRALSRRVDGLERFRPAAGGAYDYDFFKKLLLMEVRRSRRYRYPISLALASVDGWRDIAARLGARRRAALLSEVLGVASRAVRDVDLALLYSEDRFLVLMPHTDGEGGLRVSNRLVARVRAHRGGLRLTVSAGVATFEGSGAVSFSSLTRAAAEALAAAQVAGGDRAVRLGRTRKRDRVVMG
jgi:two-component system, cell cycle response regulator